MITLRNIYGGGVLYSECSLDVDNAVARCRGAL